MTNQVKIRRSGARAMHLFQRRILPLWRAVAGWLESGIEFLERQPPLERSAIAIVGLFLAMVGDVLTGIHPGYRHMYYLPIWYTAWFCNRRSAGIAATTASVWVWFAPSLIREQYTLGLVLGMAAAIFSFHLGAWMIGHFRRVYDRERHRARVDFLTGVQNTHGFYEAVNREFAGIATDFRPFALIYLDLDRFKQMNDELGHLEADKALRLIGHILRAQTRQEDVVGRVGGDEFVIYLNQIGPDMAFAAADRLRKRLEGELARRGWPLTASIGCVAFLSMPASVHKALQTADEVMYAAKHGGRSQVVKALWEGELLPAPGPAVIHLSAALR